MELLHGGRSGGTIATDASSESSERALGEARRCLAGQAAALLALADRLDDRFVAAVDALLSIRGRVVVTGVGKSGLVGRKLASTLASTGTPSFFVHATEALHGDLGMITPEDAVVFVSCSGATAELLSLLPHVRARGVLTLALVGDLESPLARGVDRPLDASVVHESCPHDLVPTTSTLIAMALGDALALALMEARGFGPRDFAVHHPGGQLGERLRASAAEPRASIVSLHR